MAQKKLIILPSLYDAAGDILKQWYVIYSVRNPKTDRMERFRVSTGLNRHKTETARRAAADVLCNDLKQKLLGGWTPFNDDEKIIYADSLAYENVSRIYGKMRTSNKNINFYASRFLEHIKSSIDNEGTLPTYRSKLRIFCMWIDKKYSSENDISAINNQVIVEFFNWLIHDQERSQVTFKKYKQILQALFEWLVKEKVFVANPVYDLPACKRIVDHSPSPIHLADIEVFRQIEDEDPQLWLAIQFEYYCALRPGKELRLLKIKNIDFARGLITIRRNESKTSITRTVVIPADFLRDIRLKHQLHIFDKEMYVISHGGKPGYTHFGKNTLRTRYNKFREKFNMPKEYKFYSWKHTGGVQAGLSGIPIRDIQNQMGHTTVATTEVYLRKMIGHQSEHLRNNFPKL